MVTVKSLLLINLGIVFAYLTLANGINDDAHAMTVSESSSDTTFFLYLPFVGVHTALQHEDVFIPAGEFQMGCDPNHNDGYECNPLTPLHAVYLDDYYFDKYEVTNGKFRTFLNLRGANDCGPYNRCVDLDSSRLVLQDGRYHVETGYENHPVNSVTWYGAEAYCTLVERRLPTEAEWEKAARGSNDTRAYPWGDESPNCSLVNYRACVGDTSEVGAFPLGVSPYGALDMSGNIMEWVNDRYDENYFSQSPYHNPQGPESGHTRVQKGAAWHFNELSIRVAGRKHYFPYKEHLRFGFRCARTP